MNTIAQTKLDVIIAGAIGGLAIAWMSYFFLRKWFKHTTETTHAILTSIRDQIVPSAPTSDGSAARVWEQINEINKMTAQLATGRQENRARIDTLGDRVVGVEAILVTHEKRLDIAHAAIRSIRAKCDMAERECEADDDPKGDEAGG